MIGANRRVFIIRYWHLMNLEEHIEPGFSVINGPIAVYTRCEVHVLRLLYQLSLVNAVHVCVGTVHAFSLVVWIRRQRHQ